MTTTFYLGHHTVIPPERGRRVFAWLMGLFVLLRKNEYSATMRLGLPPNRVVELGARVAL